MASADWYRLGLKLSPYSIGDGTILGPASLAAKHGANQMIALPTGPEFWVGLKGGDRGTGQVGCEFTVRQGGDMFSLLFAHG